MKAYQIKIELQDSEPLIWRKVIMPKKRKKRKKSKNWEKWWSWSTWKKRTSKLGHLELTIWY